MKVILTIDEVKAYIRDCLDYHYPLRSYNVEVGYLYYDRVEIEVTKKIEDNGIEHP